MIKTIRKKLLTAFITLTIIVTTLLSYNSYAAEISESHITGSGIKGGAISFDMLNTAWEILCGEHGKHIPSENNTQQVYTGSSPKNSTVGSVSEFENFRETVSVGRSSSKSGSKNYKTNHIAIYSSNGLKIATPKEAYILNEAPIKGGSDSSEAQFAWWTTEANHGNGVAANVLARTAADYESFVKKIAKNVSDTGTYQTYSHQYVDGSTVSIKFPELNTEKLQAMTSFNTINDKNEVEKTGDSWASNVTVSYDEQNQKYMIGPFSINYIEASSNGVDFGTISGFDIYTDASSEPLAKDKWRFVWVDGQRSEGDTRQYPASNEVFYIEMDYVENATMITGMDIDYKYLMAGGSYEELEGKYDITKWKLKRRTIYTNQLDSEGNNIRKWQYYFTKTNGGVGESQTLDTIQMAARWYETTKIQMRASHGKIQIVKKAVDEAGNELTADQVKDKFGEDQYFDFKVTITHADGKVENDVVTVKAGSSVIKTYSWSGEKAAPTFKVEEVPVENEAWKFVSINPEAGTLQNNGTVTVTAVNQIQDPKSNRIQITKTLSGPAETDEEFKFEVTVVLPNYEERCELASIIVPKGEVTGNTWVSEEYTWYGEKAPIYAVEEVETEASKLYTPSINPSSGELDGTGANIVVNAYNHRELKTYNNRIEINKTLEGGPAESDELFKFKVTITEADGTVHEEIAQITVPRGQTTGAPWLSKEYIWQEGENAPTYTVEEIEIPAGYTAVITPASGALDNTKSVIRVDAINYKEKKELMNRIEINKTIDGGIAATDEVFKFRVTVTKADGTVDEKIATVFVPAGEITGDAWVSAPYTWQEGEVAPTYKIEEVEVPEGYTPEIINGEGTLDGSKAKVVVNAINHKQEYKGYLTIEKDLLDGQMTDETFDFKVTVDGVKNTENGKVEFTVTGVKPGEKKGPYEFTWEGETAPTYTVEEINLESKDAKVSSITATANGVKAGEPSGNKITGQLVKDGTANIDVKFTNNITEHSGNIKVVKDIYTTEKISKETLEAEGAKFEIEVVIEGTFIHDGKNYEDTTKVITRTLPENGNWEFEISNVKWFGKEAPTYTVRETSMPTGWKTRSINYSDLENESTESEGHNLVDGKTVTATIVNELPSETVIDLTFSMAGIVWVDDTLDEKNQDNYYNQPNGVYDNGEVLKENAEVTVYRVIYDQAGNEVGRTVAKAFKDTDNNEVLFPIITKSDGKWDVPRISVPALSPDEKGSGYSVSYDVEFAYDGETYEPTEFLSYKIGSDGSATKNAGTTAERAAAYRNATTSEKDKYAKDSMALEYSNEARRITEVSGKTAIDANGDTTGIVTLDNGETRQITYSSGNAGSGYPTISRVNTTNGGGCVLDIFKATARTSVGALTFPFDKEGYDGISLQNINKTVDELGVHNKYQYMAVYNYCLNVNLGLKERATVDVGLTKNLDNAKVIVNEKLYQYKYSGNFDLTEEKVESLDKDIVVSGETQDITYDLDLYKSDYYYRADMYRNGEIYGALQSFYKTLNKTPEDTEMDIYLTYKITLRNTSSSYDVVVNSIDDYYDSSFTLVRADETKYLKTQTVGKTESNVNGEIVVANASDYADRWVDVKTGIVGSDKDAYGNNILYNKMTADNLGIKLEAGKDKEIIVTFKLDKSKDLDNAVANSIKLGQKANVAEIGSYSTYFAGTSNKAGKIDRDSAPGNVNISGNNTKAWYEDDTFAAPRLKVNVKPEAIRTINGVAWEDNSKDGNTENPGYNQQVGNGIKDSGENGIENLNTELAEKVMVPNTDGTYTEYDYIWPTDAKLDILKGKTIEEVTGFDSSIVTGVDGIYEFSNIAAGDYVVRFTYGDTKIESQDYSEAEFYNGQDYKSSKFAGSLKDGTTLRADSYLDVENLAEGRNAAVDSEVRRLEVVEKSREITYDNGVIMTEYKDALFTDYYMFADTPKISMNVELSSFGDSGYTYDVKNISFGLEERPITKLTLDKQIEEILLTTSDGNTIMNAKYNINYTVDENGEITADVTLDESNSYGTENLQALNRDLATNQGFRYINVDTSILEGASITVKYKFTVLNTGEVDRTGELANMVYAEDSVTFEAARTELSNRLATYKKSGNVLENSASQGKYVGSIYYYGAQGDSSDNVVTSTVRQLVDYVDNDADFSEMLNSATNTSWRNVTATELKELIKDDIIISQNGKDVILDSDGVLYETENKNNLIVSVDSTESKLNNAGFIVELMPSNAAGDSGKDRASMSLTVTVMTDSDLDNLQLDNIAEIIKYNNKVGRRDILTTPGNQNPVTALESEIGISTPTTVSGGMTYERDTSATEVITLSPPTGSGLMMWKLQVIGSITAGLVIIAGGIVLIKKKVLK